MLHAILATSPHNTPFLRVTLPLSLPATCAVEVSVLTLVHLAGSERASKTGAEGSHVSSQLELPSASRPSCVRCNIEKKPMRQRRTGYRWERQLSIVVTVVQAVHNCCVLVVRVRVPCSGPGVRARSLACCLSKGRGAVRALAVLGELA